MKTTIELLRENSRVSGYKINTHRRESYELFFVKGALETVRCTDTCDKEVTVYVDHGEFKGDSRFFVYPSTTREQIVQLIEEAVEKALMINNQNYELPAAEQGSYVVESNFAEYDPADLAAQIANAVFDAKTIEKISLNSVEVFVTKHTKSVLNSRGLEKTQVCYDSMIEAIPTYNGEKQSVELYEQYNFSRFDMDAIVREISEKMEQVKARSEAVRPDNELVCNVILNKQELAALFGEIAEDLNYASVYSHSNLYGKGDAIQKDPEGDLLNITMAGEAEGDIFSSKFDGDGMSLGRIQVVENGRAVNYYGSNRYGQYLEETPTGNLRCLLVERGGTASASFKNAPYLEVVSMSGLQVDLNQDYIGGEIRLAYYYDGEKEIPVTGISISGELSAVLNHMTLSSEQGICEGYTGPDKALLKNLRIF